jgi:hypothetical protein
MGTLYKCPKCQTALPEKYLLYQWNLEGMRVMEHVYKSSWICPPCYSLNNELVRLVKVE